MGCSSSVASRSPKNPESEKTQIAEAHLPQKDCSAQCGGLDGIVNMKSNDELEPDALEKPNDANIRISKGEIVANSVEADDSSMKKARDFRRKSEAAVKIQNFAKVLDAKEELTRRKEAQIAEELFAKSLDPHNSPVDNACKALLQLGAKLNLGVEDMAIINYAVRTLQLDSYVARAPIVLGQETSEDDSVVKWIREEFTQISQSRRDNPMHLKSVAVGVMLPRRLMRANTVRAGADELLRRSDLVGAEQLPEIHRMLVGTGDWGWDVFALQQAVPGRCLSILCLHVINHWGLFDEFQLDLDALMKWLKLVEGGYRDNPYHNAVHATDVVQTVHYMLETCSASRFFSKLQILALVLSAAVHDLEHDGKTNGFHKLTSSVRALTHNDTSIQENHHIMAVYLNLFTDSSVDFLSGMSAAQRMEMRRLMILSVLHTDMSKHFEEAKRLKDTIETRGTAPGKWINGGHSELLMHNILHLSDISNPAKPLSLATKWAQNVLEEFFQQGDKEREMGLPISPQCDRADTSLAKSQAGFISFVVLPAFKNLGELLPRVKEDAVACLELNLGHWESVLRANHPPTPTAPPTPTPPTPPPAAPDPPP